MWPKLVAAGILWEFQTRNLFNREQCFYKKCVYIVVRQVIASNGLFCDQILGEYQLVQRVPANGDYPFFYGEIIMAFLVKDDVLRRYLDDIRQTTPLSRSEEQTLFRLAARGNVGARERLVAANMRFVLKVALQYRGCTIPLQDLVSEGAMGLIRAIESFDYSRGLKFISYAVWWIKAYITRAINEQSGLIRLPANQHLRVKKAVKEVKNHEDLDDDIRTLLQLAEGGLSIDEPVGAEDGKSYSEVVADDRAPNPEAETEITRMEDVTKSLLVDLPEREAEVIRGLFGIDHDSPRNLREVGEALNISHERVRQLRDQALKRIRKSTHRLYLRERLEGYLAAMETCVI